VGQPAAGGFRARWIDGAVAFLDVLDLPVNVHNKRGAIGEPEVLHKDAVGLDDLAILVIAEERERGVYFRRKFFLGGNIIGADGKYFCVNAFKLCDTSLVREQFLRSTTGESSREEGQDDGRFPTEVSQVDGSAGRRRQREVRGHVPDLQVRVWRILILSAQACDYRQPEQRQ
jgi:hypothetical protein